jgi:stage II sporulation protein D
MEFACARQASLIVVIAAAIVAGSQQSTTQSAPSAPRAFIPRATLQVGMWTLWHDHELKFAPAGPNHRVSVRSCTECATLTLAQESEVRAEGDRVALTGAGKAGNARRLSLTGAITLTAHGESVTLQSPVTISARAGVLIIAVTLPVESYVERVVASESSSADNHESLKALAIVVRSFALHETHGHPDFDLCDSTHCQLLHWGGNGPRQSAAHAATLATAGETLWFHGQRALAYFGKDCGGETASPAEVQPNAKALPYLASRPDRYCAAGGGSTWASELSRSDLTAALAAHSLARPGWTTISIAHRGESGRAITLKLDATEISAEKFRLAVGQALGWNRIPSTWFEVSRQGDLFLFHGRGWGNGVGLCQKGAAVMAAQDHTAAQILEQYFPGAQAADESSGQIWRSFAAEGFTLQSLSPQDAEFLPALARAHADAMQRSGLTASTPITVRVFSSTAAFRDSTLAPGWVAAFTERQWIGTQPLRTLAARHLLDATMRHEFLHAFVERESTPNASLWLREGLVELWSEIAPASSGSPPAMKIDEIDAALAHAATERDSESAHRAARFYAARLLNHYGHAQVLAWLHSGVPSEVVSALGQR